MRRSALLYLSVAAILLLGILLVEWSRPKELDWRLSYSKEHDRPFGASLLHEELDLLFPEGELSGSREPLYRSEDLSIGEERSLFFLSERFRPDRPDRDLLFRHARNGGRVFISAREIHRKLLDSLKVEMNSGLSGDISVFDDADESDTTRLTLNGPMNTPKGGYPFENGLGRSSFSKINPINAEVLGRDGKERIVFIKVKWGEGVFYLHSKPLAFTNYYLAKEASYRYAFQALSHLPPSDIYWDEHYKPYQPQTEARTPLRFLLQHPSLRVALYLTLLALFLLLTFGAKRVQRPMAVQHPPRNATLSYARTLARLYYEDGGHGRVARMKAEHFLSDLRKRTGMEKELLRERGSWDQVARRCGFSEEAFKQAMEHVERALEGKGARNEEELMSFGRKLREVGTQTQTQTQTKSKIQNKS